MKFSEQSSPMDAHAQRSRSHVVGHWESDTLVVTTTGFQ